MQSANSPSSSGSPRAMDPPWSDGAEEVGSGGEISDTKVRGQTIFFLAVCLLVHAWLGLSVTTAADLTAITCISEADEHDSFGEHNDAISTSENRLLHTDRRTFDHAYDVQWHERSTVTVASWTEEFLAAKGGDSLVVLGRQFDTEVAKNWPGHRILDIKDWTIGKNDKFIRDVIKRGDTVYLGSSTTAGNLFDVVSGRPTVFGRELRQLFDAGYIRDGVHLLPPGGR